MPETGSTPAATEKLLEAAARVLAPLARLLIARGVTFQMASELLKRVYVRAAQKHFVEEDEATGTRLSLLTGLNRKEIRRLTENETAEREVIPMASYASAVHATWRMERQWQDSDGKPRVLSRRSGNSKHLSFDDLVRSVTTDHRPAALLEEMLRLGLVSAISDDQLTLCEESYVSRESFSDQVVQLSSSVEDHMNAAVANVLADQPLFLERNMFADELSEASAERLHKIARLHWKRVQDDVLEEALAAEAKDRESGESTKTRIRVGMYFYSETEDKA